MTISFTKSLSLTGLLLIAVSTHAGVVFQDGFESGNLSKAENGTSWGNSTSTSVESSNAKTGNYSLSFFFRGVPDGQDSWSEQRIRLGAQYAEVWVEYDLYIPSNYEHRSQSGPTNNKFIAIYANDYRNPGFQINLSTRANGSGGSNIAIHKYHNGSETSILSPSSGRDFITAADTGQWHNIRVHVKVPTSGSSNDGVIQAWKNGNLVVDYQDLAIFGSNGRNYIDEMYLIGWANSGFSEDTTFYIDNFSVSDTPVDLVRPNPPSLTRVE